MNLRTASQLMGRLILATQLQELADEAADIFPLPDDDYQGERLDSLSARRAQLNRESDSV